MPDLDQIIASLRPQLAAVLDAPNAASRDLEATRKRLEGLREIIGRRAVSEAMRALQGSERALLRHRQREAAVKLAALGKSLGIPLTAGMPSKRQRKQPTVPKLSPTAETQEEGGLSDAR